MKRSLSTDSFSSASDHDEKRTRTNPGFFEGIAIYIIQTKLEPTELDLLYSLVETHGANIQSTPEHADVIITGISMRKRLERHIDWNLAKMKAIVTPAWITHSVANEKRLSYGDYAAVCCLEKCTSEKCLDHGAQASKSGELQSPPPSQPRNLSYMARFAVQRASPLISQNQDFIFQLAVIRDARVLDGDERSAMSYSRSIAVGFTYPFRIHTAEQIAHLPFVGSKILGMAREYLFHGTTSETSMISQSSRYRSLNEFMRIHGIGAFTARKLYDEGCRTLEDLDRRYGAELGKTEEDQPVIEGETAGIRTALELRDSLSVLIAREEVENIDRIIGQELELVEPGCLRTIVGGYRRGKQLCNDVDIVFTHPQPGKEQNLCKRLVERLRRQGLVTHILHISSFRSSSSLRAPVGASKPDRPHWDTLDKALTIFRLPSKEGSMERSFHRRVDLIFAPIATYWTAVVGWTGSTLFERDLRLWAKQKMGMKFDNSGITRRRDTKPFFPMSEHAVFEILGLEWIDPTLRNADV
ncbi:Nucleotidyltransferase [Hysterangium stoloniferum]|nr:Nucleotidyltransferase [Hysterangium stoloniferum]